METLSSTTIILPTPSSATSSPSIHKCAHCPNSSKYTCPRCATHTCSLSCTHAHKFSTRCTGVRDKAAYVPMNKYGWGRMMDDYCFLEDVGRKVGEWGREIVRGGFDMGVGSSVGRGGRGRGRGRGRGGREGGRERGGKGKREALKMFLGAQDIELELLPNGMERRLLNQSVWDQRNQTALMTIQFKFHPSAEARATSLDTFTLLTHRNDISTILLALVQKHIQERMNKKTNAKRNETSSNAFPSWVSSLVIPPPEDPENFTTPTFVIAAPADPMLLARSVALISTQKYTCSTATSKPKVYYSLDPHEPLAKSLRGTQFIEFPLIEVWEEFNGVIVDKTGGVRCTGRQEEPQRKRRKLNREEGIKAINGLLGDYGSDDGGEDGRVEDGVENALVEYVESDTEDGSGQDNIVDEEISLDDDEWSDADAEGEIDFDADPAILFELIQQAKKEGKWKEDDGDDSDDAGELVQASGGV